MMNNAVIEKINEASDAAYAYAAKVDWGQRGSVNDKWFKAYANAAESMRHVAAKLEADIQGIAR